MREKNHDRILNLTDEILDTVAERYGEELAPAIPRVWKSEVEDVRTDLRGWIRQVLQSGENWKPVHFEFAFGLPLDRGRDPSSSAEEVLLLERAHLRGSIDLIERDEERGVLRVVDHKTGKAPKERPWFLGGGEMLQPLLYALAAEGLLKSAVESGELFYCTQRGEYRRFKIELSEEARQKVEVALDTIDSHIDQGFLAAAPRQGACEFCDYRVVCGPYEEIRLKRKQQDPLGALQKLRDIP